MTDKHKVIRTPFARWRGSMMQCLHASSKQQYLKLKITAKGRQNMCECPQQPWHNATHADIPCSCSKRTDARGKLIISGILNTSATLVHQIRHFGGNSDIVYDGRLTLYDLQRLQTLQKRAARLVVGALIADVRSSRFRHAFRDSLHRYWKGTAPTSSGPLRMS